MIYGTCIHWSDQRRAARGLGRVVMVGEQVTGDDPTLALTGAFMRRVCKLSGMTTDEYLRAFDRANVLLPGQDWSQAAVNARSIAAGAGDRFLLLFGRRVAAAFGHPSADWFDVVPVGRTRARVMPHPSGRSRWWNDPSNARRASELLVELRKALVRP